MAVRITSISLGIALILLTFSVTASLASYCGPDPGCAPPLKVNVRGPGMPYGGPAMAGPRPMYGAPGCPPPCPPPSCAPACPPPCPPPSCEQPACPPPTCNQRGCFNPIGCIFDLIICRSGCSADGVAIKRVLNRAVCPWLHRAVCRHVLRLCARLNRRKVVLGP